MNLILYTCLSLLAAFASGEGDGTVSKSKSIDSQACMAKGYDSNELFCSTCDKLQGHELAELEEECRACCQQDQEAQDEVKKYTRAELRVCG